MTVQRRLPKGFPTDPCTLFERLSTLPGAFWLDSGATLTHHAQHHFLGALPSRWLRLSPQAGERPFEALRALFETSTVGPTPAIPAARVVGWLAYDLGRFVERLPDPGGPSPDEVVMGVYDASLTVDMKSAQATLTATDERAAARLLEALDQNAAPSPPPTRLTVGQAQPQTSAETYREQIHQIQGWIAAGDCYQVNLSHRLEAQLAPGVDAAQVYSRLRNRHPACFGGFFDAGDITLVSNSPEAFLAVDLRPGHARVVTWPLKGTRPAGTDPTLLSQSPKDRAEHVMIVDLERNDLGRIAIPGSVHVPALMSPVAHSTVVHLESRVEATPRPEVDLVDILVASFPGGSVTGAPKIRAMQIIAALEGERRGPYCGAFGYLGFGGQQSAWSIPIRTALITSQGALSLRVGGAVVADSNPQEEWEETLTKARAFLDILGPPKTVD